MKNTSFGSLIQMPQVGIGFRLTKGIATAGVSLLIAAAGAVTAEAEVFDRDYYAHSSSSSFRGELGLFSDRMFRGQNLYNGVSIQPKVRGGIDLGFGELFGSVSSHFSGDQNHEGSSEDRRSFNEFTFEVGDRFTFDEFAFEGGYRFYNYSRTTSRLQDTGEFFAGVDSMVLGHPYFQLAYDTNKHKGWYYELGLFEKIPFRDDGERDVIVPSVALGFSSGLDDDEHPIYDDGGITHVGVGVKGVLGLDETTSFQPEVRYNVEVDDATTSDFTFGMSLVSEFAEPK